MDHLPTALRRELEKAVISAYVHAQCGAVAALRRRAVDAAEAFPHFSDADKDQRNRLLARGHKVGDVRHPADATQDICKLAQELAYEFWHRMLFARFLAENNLLMHPDGVPVSLEECDDLAPSADPPAANGFALAARYASKMLPQIFRTDDVLLEIEYAPEHRLALEQILAGLSPRIFRASESLGWSYQFWQSRRKDEINRSGEKIDGSTIAPVTQLFTETYMVEFLLHNTIGAWWCANHGVTGPPGGAGTLPGTTPVPFDYLRWGPDGHPAAGRFEGWPKTVREFTLMDPCCGSYHFLVTAFKILAPLRMCEEALTAAQAVDAVLSDNLHGLDIDPCCSKLAAFSLAFVAWRYPDESGEAGGYRKLPALNVACSGQPLDKADREAWLKFANGDRELRGQIGELFSIFAECYHVGSLIDPVLEAGPLFRNSSGEILPKLARQLAKYQHDAEFAAIGVAAQGLAKAAELLSGRYTLVATNVPYLGRGKQGDEIKEHLDKFYTLGRADLATAFVLRCLQLCQVGGSTALVTPQNWHFLSSYKKLREELLKQQQWDFVVNLGEEAWLSFGNRGPRTILFSITASRPANANTFFGIDVSTNRGDPIIPREEKADRLANRLPTPMQVVEQAGQLKNPDAVIVVGGIRNGELLCTYAHSHKGISTGDDAQFVQTFWEQGLHHDGWVCQQSASDSNSLWKGLHYKLLFESGKGRLRKLNSLQERDRKRDLHGLAVWGKRGVSINLMGELETSIYSGTAFDTNISALVPQDQSQLAAMWCFCSSKIFVESVRALNQKLSIADSTLAKVPFDLAHWQAVADEKYPNGLPEPHSDDPTQWLFKGDIASSTDPLQVAVARLCGYRWPDQPEGDAVVDPFVDDDGIVCLPGVRHEAPAAERLADLLRAVGHKTEVDLAVWLRESFFAEHCKRFHQRPFLWHVWDGRKDGFAALVNYHKLTHKTLENLTYSYLGDWITAQSKSDKPGADLRFAAAQALQAKLKLILAGEPPYDLFVRWKPLYDQAVGWQPDLNDGVRMNIRPFVEADILRKTPNVKWGKDRGKEPPRDAAEYPWFNAAGERVNDIHLTHAQKQAARDKMQAKGGRP